MLGTQCSDMESHNCISEKNWTHTHTCTYTRMHTHRNFQLSRSTTAYRTEVIFRVGIPEMKLILECFDGWTELKWVQDSALFCLLVLHFLCLIFSDLQLLQLRYFHTGQGFSSSFSYLCSIVGCDSWGKELCLRVFGVPVPLSRT